MVLFCMFLTVNTFATSVTQDNATKVAKNYFSEVLASQGKNFTPMISESFELTKDGNTVLYVFNFEKGGYIVVSAEDQFTPIIGYSPDGYYDQNNLPDGLKSLLEDFSDMIAFIREKNIAGEPKYAEKWERYRSDDFKPDRSRATVVVAPMTALWNQDSPYNFYAPPAKGGPGGKAYAGCVATAMSIIMYYWRWPWQGTGSFTYTSLDCSDGSITEPIELSADFSTAYYDYNGMFGTTTQSADKVLSEPIALLQYHAGVSARMHYCGPDGSGAYSNYVPNPMRNYFKYASNIQFLNRSSYSTDAWLAIIKNQLDLKQPVYTSGSSPTTGHAYVCDGYNSDDMVYYNFGWSGSSNGYYVVDGPYTYYNLKTSGAIINFIPDRAQGYPINCNNTWTISWMKGTIADCSGPVDNYYAGTTSKWLIDPALAGNHVKNITIGHIEMDLAAGDFLRIYDGETESDSLLGEFTGNEPFEAITSTGAKVLVKFTSATNSPTAKGFMISYDAEAIPCCDPRAPITMTARVGKFTDGSPENLNYNNNAGPCSWFISPENPLPETEITLKFNRLDTEEADVIKIINQSTNKLVANVSGRYGPEDELPQFTVKTAKIKVMFSSNSYVNGTGFEIEYEAKPVSINELEDLNYLAVYPNPVKDKLFVKFNTEIADDYNITICNVMGQIIYRETLNNFVGDYDNSLNFSSFAKGVYMLQIKSSKGMITRKIVR